MIFEVNWALFAAIYAAAAVLAVALGLAVGVIAQRGNRHAAPRETQPAQPAVSARPARPTTRSGRPTDSRTALHAR